VNSNQDYKGLIPKKQQDLEFQNAIWKFGHIKDGYKIIDPVLHYACFVLGYNDNAFIDNVVDRFKNVRPEVPEFLNLLDAKSKIDPNSFHLAEKLYAITGGYRSIFSLSGSDANEGAVKLASAYHGQLGNMHRKNIVSLKPSYHGSTLLTSSLGYENAMGEPFYTMESYPNIIRLDRDFDVDAVDWDSVFCMIVETCSYGQHMTPFTDEFWNKLTHIQNTHNVILIIDDIFMGGGKTGNFVGWQHLPVTPDIFTMGKAVTAGHFPLSIVLYNDKISKVLGPDFAWNHGYTYSFLSSGVASVLEYIDVLERDNLLGNYQTLVDRATNVFLDNRFTIINQFGLYFLIAHDQTHELLYLIPLTADDEYFNVLADNLTALTQI
jgi:adenosylmethionine-8-amino-7-oxononanoate aminotransferase